MKKMILSLGTLFVLSFQSCMKEYYCECAGTTNIGTMKAMTRTEADRGCRAMGQSDVCVAEL